MIFFMDVAVLHPSQMSSVSFFTLKIMELAKKTSFHAGHGSKLRVLVDSLQNWKFFFRLVILKA